MQYAGGMSSGPRSPPRGPLLGPRIVEAAADLVLARAWVEQASTTFEPERARAKVSCSTIFRAARATSSAPSQSYRASVF